MFCANELRVGLWQSRPLGQMDYPPMVRSRLRNRARGRDRKCNGQQQSFTCPFLPSGAHDSSGRQWVAGLMLPDLKLQEFVDGR